MPFFLSPIQASLETLPGAPSNIPDNECSFGAAGGRLCGRRVAVLLFSYYPSDSRPRLAAEALASEGALVDVICLRETRTEPRREIINGVNVRRLGLKRHRGGKLSYIGQYFAFILWSFVRLTLDSIRARYDVVHVHNMPDVLVLSALVPKALGAGIILDLHDPMPELMMSIYNLDAGNYFVRLLKRLERLSIWFADLVLTPNQAFRELFIKRGCPPGKIQIVMNSPDHEIFDSSKYDSEMAQSPTNASLFRIMYHGLIVERYGLDIALQAFAKARVVIPGLEFHIFGERTPYMNNIDAQVRELGLSSCVHYHGFQSQIDIAKSITSMDLGIVPNRRNPFTELNMPIRIFEYLAMGKPVVVPDTEGIRDYFGPDSALFFNPGDSQSLFNAIVDVYRNRQKVSSVLKRAEGVCYAHRWEIYRARFLELVSLLVSANQIGIERACNLGH